MNHDIRLFNPDNEDRKEASGAMGKILPTILDLRPEIALNVVMVLLCHCVEDMDSNTLDNWFFNFKLMRVDFRDYKDTLKGD